MKYKYAAYNEEGKKIEDNIEAPDIKKAKHLLAEDKIYVINIEEFHEKDREFSSSKTSSPKKIRYKLKNKELITFTHQMWILLKAGYQVNEAFQELHELELNKKTRAVIDLLKTKVESGTNLSKSISELGSVFPSYFSNIITGGENTGEIAESFYQIYMIATSEFKLKRKITAILVYPVFMLCLAVIFTIILMGSVIPNLTVIFQDMGHNLPLITRILINISNFFSVYWYYFLIILIILIYVCKELYRLHKIKYFISLLKLRIPFLKNLFIKLLIVRFSQTLGLLLRNDVDLIVSLKISADITGLTLLSDKIKSAADRITAGGSLSDSLDSINIFPNIYIKMLSTGEKSSDLPDTLINIHDLYDTELETDIATITAVLEPIMMIIVGIVICFIVFSIIIPIIRMNAMI